MDNKLTLPAEIDLQPILDAIATADTLDDNEQLFGQLAQIQAAKKAFELEKAKLELAEFDVKQAINARAKALYGDAWAAIKGNGYKITRSQTGAVYEITGKAPAKFTKVAVTVDTDAVNAYVEEKGKLPTGIAINQSRGESIRITVKEPNGAEQEQSNDNS